MKTKSTKKKKKKKKKKKESVTCSLHAKQAHDNFLEPTLYRLSLERISLSVRGESQSTGNLFNGDSSRGLRTVSRMTLHRATGKCVVSWLQLLHCEKSHMILIALTIALL